MCEMKNCNGNDIKLYETTKENEINGVDLTASKSGTLKMTNYSQTLQIK